MGHDCTKIKAKETIEAQSVTFSPTPLEESMLCSVEEPKHGCLNIFLATVFLIIQKRLQSKYPQELLYLILPLIGSKQIHHHGDKLPLPLWSPDVTATLALTLQPERSKAIPMSPVNTFFISLNNNVSPAPKVVELTC